MMMTVMTKNKKPKTIVRTWKCPSANTDLCRWCDVESWKHTLTIKKHFVRFNLHLKRKMCFKTLKHHHHQQQHVQKLWILDRSPPHHVCGSWLSGSKDLACACGNFIYVYILLSNSARRLDEAFFSKSHKSNSFVWDVHKTVKQQRMKLFNVISAISIFPESPRHSEHTWLVMSCRLNDLRFHTNNKKEFCSLLLVFTIAGVLNCCIVQLMCVVCTKSSRETFKYAQNKKREKKLNKRHKQSLLSWLLININTSQARLDELN